MASEDENKVLTFKKPDAPEGPDHLTEEQKKERAKAIDMALRKEKKHPLGAAWWIGIIILILISISFVAGPAIEAAVARRSTGLSFGSYNGEDITFEQGNYFFDQYQNYADRFRGSSSNPEQAAYQIWSNAYYSTVVYTALSQMAKKAGIIASDPVVNRQIINSGYYDKDGKFDTATYNATSAERKQAIDTSVRRNLVPSMVMSDITSVLSSSAEKDFVASMADDSRSFQYVTFGVDSYPDEEASRYGLANADLFRTFGLSMASAADQAGAQALLDRITSGEAFSAVAESSSTDGFAAEGGKVGDHVYFFQLERSLKNADDAQQIVSAAVGQPIGPLETQNGWVVLQKDSELAPADFADQTTLNAVKVYISLYESQMLDDWLDDQAVDFAAKAGTEGFAQAADAAGLAVTDVAATPLNVGGSSYLGSFAYTDPNQQLAQITDSQVLKQLYDAEVDAVTGPVQAGTSYLVVKSGEKTSSGIGETLKQFYDYMTSTSVQSDLQYAILHSDKFSDNFLTVFLEQIIGSGSGSQS